MMLSVQIAVDEIVTSCDSAGVLLYSYVHMERKVGEQELARAIKTLEDNGEVRGSNIFGYDAIASSSINSSELIEDHPGFRTLVQHEAAGNENFHRWTADGFPRTNCGYNLLKSKLLAKRMSRQTAGGASLTDQATADDARPQAASDDEESTAGSRWEHTNQERSKRRRNTSPFTSHADQPKGTDVFNFMKTVYEDTKRKGDDVSQLREQVATLRFEKELIESNGRAYKANAELLSAKEDLGQQRRLVNELTFKLEEQSTISKEQYRIAQEAITARKKIEEDWDVTLLHEKSKAAYSSKAELDNALDEIHLLKDAKHELNIQTRNLQAEVNAHTITCTAYNALKQESETKDAKIATQDIVIDVMAEREEQMIAKLSAREEAINKLQVIPCS